MNNDLRRFHVFVANPVQQIRSQTNPNQWEHVASKNYPTDLASRGLFPSEFIKKTSWLFSPEFLRKEDVHLEEDEAGISLNDPKVKWVQSLATNTKKADPSMTER